MHLIFKLTLASFSAFLLTQTVIADNFVQLKSPKKPAKITPLTPFDKALKKEMEKYPKDSAFFIDGRTGKIISINKIPKQKDIKKITKKHPPKPPKQDTPKVVPYEIQEERIKLL